ncbi:MAG: DRTGG domain-containing protein [Candidatus Hodarchaeota archaeon]
MKKIVVASTHEEAGKTSLIIGLAKALAEKKKIGYMKPLGDRLLYQKKRLWDYDSALVTNILGLQPNPEDLSLGFAHSKLRYMYDEKTTKEKLAEMCSHVCQDKDIIFLEGSKNLSFGRSVYLDPLTVVRSTNSQLLLVLSGDEDVILDDITFLHKCVKVDDIDFLGVIINQIKDIDDFKNLYLKAIEELGVNILGIIPFREEMSHFTMDYLNETLFAKVLAGDGGMKNTVKHIFVGAMSATHVVKRSLWGLENKLIITPGDRPDMIIAALDSSTAGIVLTNNILPEDPIIESKANSLNIPLLLVPDDTFSCAKKIDKMEILFTKDETDKINLLENLVNEYVDLSIFED